MTKRKTLAVAAATALLIGSGAFGATTALASPSGAAPAAALTATSSPPPGIREGSTDAMIRHCTQQLPAAERGKAQQQMRAMMADS
jgi:hypothetical protein